VKGIYRIIGIFLFLALYVSAITISFVPRIDNLTISETSFLKKEVQISVYSSESVFSPVEIVSDNFQNAHPSGLKKQIQELQILERICFSKEKSKFKQYQETWNNQLIVSKKTDQLYPHHSFG
jgi:hypothetical protein